MSRTENTIKNIKTGMIAQIVTIALGFISRTVFIHFLGANYLGVNGLFSNVLGILSMAELGIGMTMNYSLYKPVAQNDKETIKAQLSFFKKIYYIIAAAVALIGLALLPFLHFMVKDPGYLDSPLEVYYLIFLFNTVISYLVTYQFSLVNAEQKTYLFTRINLAFSIITRIIEILALILGADFLTYLLISSISGVIQRVYLTVFFRKLYPFLYDEKARKLTEEEIEPIKKNINGVVYHKFADVAIHSTDNIIISAAVNLTTVGFVSNYTTISGYVQTFLGIVFNNVVPSLGNLVAEKSLHEQFKIFKIYNFFDFWLYGFSSIALAILFQPFITLWAGDQYLIDEVSVLLFCANFYFAGQRIAFLNYKTAHGKFYEDKYVVFGSALINLVVSIALVNVIGLPGIYIGTVVSGLYQSIRRPIIAYNRVTGDKTINYFKLFCLYFASLLPPYLVLRCCSILILSSVSWPRFIFMIALTATVPNLFFWACYRRTEEFKYAKSMIKERIKIHKR